MARAGWYEPVTVAAATRYLPIANWPGKRPAQEDVLRTELDASLDLINDFLVALSLIQADPRLQPVSRGDLWAAAPVILEALPTPTPKPCGTSFIYQIHADLPQLPFPKPADDGSAEAASTLATLERRGEQPFFLFYELMQRASAANDAHRYRESIVFLGTAVEVFLTVVLRDATRLRTGRAVRLRGRGLKGRVANHLGHCANIQADPDDPTTTVGRWWAGGYALRNRVVHGGYEPTRMEAARAFEDANLLVVSVRDGLRGSPDTAELGAKLEWGSLEEREASVSSCSGL